MHLLESNNHCKRDLKVFADTPFSATADATILFVRGGGVDRTNTEMMNVRWSFFHFTKQILLHLLVKLTPHAHCFAKLILENMEYVILEKDTRCV